MIHVLGSPVVLLLGHLVLELVGTLLSLQKFFLFHLSQELLLPQFLSNLLILELFDSQLLLSSICLLFFLDLIKLLILERFIPFDYIKFLHLHVGILIEELVFHDVVDLVVSFEVFVGLFGFNIINVREDRLWLEILRFVTQSVPVVLSLMLLILVLNSTELNLLFHVKFLFLLVFGRHLKQLVFPLFGHFEHSVAVLVLTLSEILV